MSASLHLAKPDDMARIAPLVAAFHDEDNIKSDESSRLAALAPLLEGNPYGAVYLIGPQRAPIGYVVVAFSWSLELGGCEGFIDELYVRPAVRGRGIATEVLLSLARNLAQAGVVALSLEVDRTNTRAQSLYHKSGFIPRDRYVLMTRKL